MGKMVLFAPILMAAFAALTETSPAYAHSWYPLECCAEGDCMAADRILPGRDGDRFVVAGRLRVWIPRGFVARTSADEKIHICIFRGEFNMPMPRCLFLPPQS
jgi:hypothetical protein